MSDILFKTLSKPETLRKGWHLARLDTKQDFAEDLYSTDVFGHELHAQIQEISNRIQTDSYIPRPLLRMEVPKGRLGFRPGSVIPIQDRVLVSSIVYLLSPSIDEKLIDGVYSWRLKNPIPKSGPIFNEMKIEDLPFLKQKTIRDSIDPFTSWYSIWPEFDKTSRSTFRSDGYRYLATSDIAAYFENIQLPILRDQLMSHYPNETKIINLLCLFLESWAHKTLDGRPHHRGIPQGNFVSSFLGNLFLIPLDNCFTKFMKKKDIKYYRYMDDVRIFTRTEEDARLAIFSMDRELRRLHLNVQTAKTKIFDETLGEISNQLIDERVDKLSKFINQINKTYGNSPIPKSVRNSNLKLLVRLVKPSLDSQQLILGSHRPLEGLAMRVFARWITAHCVIKSDKYVNRLLIEINRNADHKLSKKLISTTKTFPRKKSFQHSILKFIESESNIFPHQEAECIRALRYLSRLDTEVIDHAKERLHDTESDTYLRVQSAYLLSRESLTHQFISGIHKRFTSELNPYVQVAMAGLLVQSRKNNSEIVSELVFHPNEKVREIGRLFRAVKNDPKLVKKQLIYVLDMKLHWIICDNMPFLHLMSNSTNIEVKKLLVEHIREPRIKHPICGIRDILKEMFTRVRISLN